MATAIAEDQKGTVYDYILSEEANFSTIPVEIVDGWAWQMKRHIKVSTLYKNSQLETGKLEGTPNEKPVKNIVLPLLNLRYRAEDIDVKDVVLYVDDPDEYYFHSS